MATTPCALISPGDSFCYNVGGYGFLVVGHSLAGGLEFGIARGGTRRLLESTNSTPHDWWYLNNQKMVMEINRFDKWSHVAPPCSELVKAFLDRERMGVLDTKKLHSCVHWRKVGNETIHKFNLTKFLVQEDSYEDTTEDSHFLMSVQDFSSVITKRGRFLQVFEFLPRLGAHVISKTEFFAPIMTIIETALQNWGMVVSDLETKIPEFVNYSTVQKDIVSSDIPMKYLSSFMQSEISLERSILLEKEKEFILKHTETGTETRTGTEAKTKTSGPKRSLMQAQSQQEGESTDDGISRFSILTASTSGFSNIALEDAVAASWLEGPFFWPPRFSYWEGDDKCVMYTTAKDIAISNALVLNKFYTTDYVKNFQKPPWDIKHNLPKFYNGTPPVNETMGQYRIDSTKIARNNDGGDWVANFYTFFGETVLEGVFGITPSKVQSIFVSGKGLPRDTMTAGNIIKDVLICDFESVVLCSRHNRNMVMSFIIAYLIYLVIYTVFSTLNLKGIASFVWLAIPMMTIWLAYGMAPTCLPMIPTCIITDVIDTLQVIFPAKIIWPNSLQAYPECISPSWIRVEKHAKEGLPPPVTPQHPDFPDIKPGSKECMRSCKGAPFYFTGWESSLGWIACGVMDSSRCRSLSIPYFPLFKETVVNHSSVLLMEDDGTGYKKDLLDGYSFCFWITLAQALPWFFLLIVVVYMGVALLRIPFMMLTAGAQFVMQAVSYTHVE